MPGITTILPLKSRDPDNCVLLRFIKRFKSFDVIRKMGKTRFLDSYQVLVKKTKDRFAGSKGLAIYELILNSVTTRGENPLSAMTQDQCVDLVSTSQKAADEINLQMRIIAETMPEYKVLRSMAGVGDRLGPIILGEIGDIRRFHSGKALNAYAGNDAPPYQSGQFESRNRHISKRGNPALRKACFEVMQALKLTKPQDDPVYLFLLKKEQEGKEHRVAYTFPDSGHHIAACSDTLHQHGINRHAHHNEHPLKANGEQGFEIVVTHVARLPVCAGGKGNGGKARHQVNFNHAPVDDDENHDIQSRHGKLHEERLQENTEERPQFHGFKLGLHIIQHIRRDGGGALYQARRLLDSSFSSMRSSTGVSTPLIFTLSTRSCIFSSSSTLNG